MKTLLCILFLITTTGYCSDLEIVSCNVFLIKTEKKETEVKIEKEWKKVEKEYYTYRVALVLKNTSDKELSVITRGLDISGRKEPSEIGLGLGHSKVKGVAIVPPVVDFAIVSLKPGEGASIRFRDGSLFKHEKVTVIYQPGAVHKGRFEYWTGRVKSPVVEVKDLRETWPEWNPKNSHWLQRGY